jgi:hypothetical protein
VPAGRPSSVRLTMLSAPASFAIDKSGRRQGIGNRIPHLLHSKWRSHERRGPLARQDPSFPHSSHRSLIKITFVAVILPNMR